MVLVIPNGETSSLIVERISLLAPALQRHLQAAESAKLKRDSLSARGPFLPVFSFVFRRARLFVASANPGLNAGVTPRGRRLFLLFADPVSRRGQ